MYLSSSRALAIARIATGLYFLVTAIGKLGWYTSADALTRTTLSPQSLANATPFYRSFLESVVVPNAGTFAVLVVTAELVVGISLTLGLLTRLGAIVGIW